MIKSFYYRLVVVFVLVLTTSLVIASVAVLPSYFLSSIKKNLANQKLVNQKAEPVPELDQKTLADIKNLSNELDLVETAENNKFNVSQKIISAIILHKISGIQITEISYVNDPATGSKISLNGLASSREVLLLFRQALQNDALFKTVDLPISNFVKGSNIEFYLSLTPA